MLLTAERELDACWLVTLVDQLADLVHAVGLGVDPGDCAARHDPGAIPKWFMLQRRDATHTESVAITKLVGAEKCLRVALHADRMSATDATRDDCAAANRLGVIEQ